MRCFSVFDRKAGSYGLPVFYASIAEAVRSLTVAVNDTASKSALALFSADFDLFDVGEWNYDAGIINREEDTAKFIINLGSLKEVANGKQA